jgi:hypothetical protein
MYLHTNSTSTDVGVICTYIQSIHPLMWVLYVFIPYEYYCDNQSVVRLIMYAHSFMVSDACMFITYSYYDIGFPSHTGLTA